MILEIAEEVSARIDWSAFTILGMPPRDPDEDEGDEDEGDENDERADEPAVVREPDED